jgi:hypothetical protein
MRLPFFQVVDKSGKNIGKTEGAAIAENWDCMVAVAEAAAKQVSAGDDDEDEMVVEDVDGGEWDLLKTGTWEPSRTGCRWGRRSGRRERPQQPSCSP